MYNLLPPPRQPRHHHAAISLQGCQDIESIRRFPARTRLSRARTHRPEPVVHDRVASRQVRGPAYGVVCGGFRAEDRGSGGALLRGKSMKTRGIRIRERIAASSQI
jgi:hypothetical protein